MVSLRDISTRLGVTHITVSRALNGTYVPRHKAAVARAEEIRRVAAEMGYRPNAAAVTMQTGRFNGICLLQSTVTMRSELPNRLLQGILEEVGKRGLHLSLAQLPDEQLTGEGIVPRILQESACDGLLINYNALIPAAMIERIKGSGLPAIWLNSKHADNCVYPDDFGAAQMLVDKLAGLGHREIAYVDYSSGSRDTPWHYSDRDRLAGYRQSMAAHGLGSLVVQEEDEVPFEERIAHSRRWLRGSCRPTAAICYNTWTALPLLHAAALEGVSVPEAFSICTFGELHRLSMGLSLGMAMIPNRAMGRMAVDTLTARIAQSKTPEPAKAVPFTIETGDTMAGPPKGRRGRSNRPDGLRSGKSAQKNEAV